jgi:hypothetical protein
VSLSSPTKTTCATRSRRTRSKLATIGAGPRRPPAGKPPTTAAREVTISSAQAGHPRTAPAPAARSRPLACLGSIRQNRGNRIDPPARGFVGYKGPRQGTELRCRARMFQERRVRYAADYRALARSGRQYRHNQHRRR